jgi:hypothetical protein
MGIDEEDLKKRAEALHKQNIALWDRFQQLNRKAGTEGLRSLYNDRGYA